jgi:hypothetical protein
MEYFLEVCNYMIVAEGHIRLFLVRSILYPSIKASIFPAVVINGQRRIDRSTFDASLALYMNSSNVLLGVANNATLGISINDLTSAYVDISWTYSQPVHIDSNYDPLYKPDRTSDESTTISEAFFTELNELIPLAPPFADFYNTEAVRSSRLYNWLMRIIRIPRKDLDSSISSNIILLGDAARAMAIFAISMLIFSTLKKYSDIIICLLKDKKNRSAVFFSLIKNKN